MSKHLIPVCTLLAASVPATAVLSFFAGLAMLTLTAFGIVAAPV